MNKKTTEKNNENYQGIFDIKLAKYVKSGSERDIYIYQQIFLIKF
ncbi:MAG: hypothetical protein VX335_00095 [Pseudomonadota bacterium]|nr:hypothetical protein [Pseudomonadota bacterium]